MPLGSIPAIDAAACSGWTEQQTGLYNALPYYLAKMQVELRKQWAIWSKITGRVPWTPNMGPTMRSVRKVPSPHMRQFAFPNEICEVPKKDVMDVREVSVDVNVYKHRFESPVLDFCNSFRDFLTDHVDANGQDIMEKINRFDDVYIRGNIFHMSPFAFLAVEGGAKRVNAPFWLGTGTKLAGDGKTAGWLNSVVMENPLTSLTMCSVASAVSQMETQLRVPPFTGRTVPADNKGLEDKYLLIQSGESWNQFTFDKYLQAHKNCDLDVVNNGFKGSLFGRVTSRLEDLPLRFQEDGTFVEPELRVGTGGNDYNVGETVPNPEYAEFDSAALTGTPSPYEVAFLAGSQGYDSIEVGPPPKHFASDNPPDNFAKMFWNGEVRITKKFLVECVDDQGAVVKEMNAYGDKLKFISQSTFGIRPRQRRNVIPIIFKRTNQCA